MKWFVVICVFAFFAGWCLNKETEAARHKQHCLNKEIKPQEDDEEDDDGAAIEEFFIEKYVESNIENYSFRFDIDVPLKNVKKVQLKAPNGKKTEFKVKDTLDLTALCSEADERYANYEDFQNAFPEGNYTFTFTPKKYGSLKVYMKHDFPSTPVILSPEDGDTMPASGFTIEWEDMGDEDLESLILHIDGEDGFSLKVPVIDTTSFNVQDGLLEPNTEYWIELRAQKRPIFSDVYDENCRIRTVRCIDFFTESE